MPQNDQQPTNDRRRTIIGILTIFFMLGALAFEIWPPTQAFGYEWKAACWRLTPILALLWLAYHDLKRIPWWLWLTMPVVIIVLIKWPKLLLFFIPPLILLTILSLRIKSR